MAWSQSLPKSENEHISSDCSPRGDVSIRSSTQSCYAQHCQCHPLSNRNQHPHHLLWLRKERSTKWKRYLTPKSDREGSNTLLNGSDSPEKRTHGSARKTWNVPRKESRSSICASWQLWEWHHSETGRNTTCASKAVRQDDQITNCIVVHAGMMMQRESCWYTVAQKTVSMFPELNIIAL